MYEMMFDLETLDTKPSAVVLSIGAVIWETMYNEEAQILFWDSRARFMRVLDMDDQFVSGRTVSQSTILWWQRQDPTARAEAFNPVRRPVYEVLNDFYAFAKDYDINAFWASPATFDFPIWEDLARTFGNSVPWTYREKYDVRTVVREAGFSVHSHQPTPSVFGVAHTPVFDCELQIDILTAARQKMKRRMGQ